MIDYRLLRKKDFFNGFLPGSLYGNMARSDAISLSEAEIGRSTSLNPVIGVYNK
jgi:hypothetical protein